MSDNLRPRLAYIESELRAGVEAFDAPDRPEAPYEATQLALAARRALVEVRSVLDGLGQAAGVDMAPRSAEHYAGRFDDSWPR